MAQIQFGWSMPSGPREESHRASYVTDLQRDLELLAGHFDSAWIIDHLQRDGSYLMEGWTALTYMAAHQPRLMFGNAVVCQSFRNPALLAKMAATFQYLSGGRFILGIGAGWKKDEYLAYGYDFPPVKKRFPK